MVVMKIIRGRVKAPVEGLIALVGDGYWSPDAYGPEFSAENIVPAENCLCIGLADFVPVINLEIRLYTDGLPVADLTADVDRLVEGVIEFVGEVSVHGDMMDADDPGVEAPLKSLGIDPGMYRVRVEDRGCYRSSDARYRLGEDAVIPAPTVVIEMAVDAGDETYFRSLLD